MHAKQGENGPIWSPPNPPHRIYHGTSWYMYTCSLYLIREILLKDTLPLLSGNETKTTSTYGIHFTLGEEQGKGYIEWGLNLNKPSTPSAKWQRQSLGLPLKSPSCRCNALRSFHSVRYTIAFSIFCSIQLLFSPMRLCNRASPLDTFY